jgi:hypothetical protein
LVLTIGITSLDVTKSKQRLESNDDSAKNPQAGDFWHEMFTPIVVVVARPNDETVLICRKTTLVGVNHWEWDLTKCECLRVDEFKNYLSYESTPGYWANVVPKKMEWVRETAMMLMFGEEMAT